MCMQDTIEGLTQGLVHLTVSAGIDQQRMLGVVDARHNPLTRDPGSLLAR
jgi:hypothetical protein